MNNMVHRSTRNAADREEETKVQVGQGMPTTHVVCTAQSVLAFLTDLGLYAAGTVDQAVDSVY